MSPPLRPHFRAARRLWTFLVDRDRRDLECGTAVDVCLQIRLREPGKPVVLAQSLDNVLEMDAGGVARVLLMCDTVPGEESVTELAQSPAL